MSLYYEAEKLLQSDGASTLKARVYGARNLKASAAQVYGLCVEATRWSSVLSGIVEKSGLLEVERKLTPTLALLLTYDLLVGKGVAARKDHALTLAINRHKARLGAELTRERIRQGQSSLEGWRKLLLVDSQTSARVKNHPRWVRINTLVTTVHAETVEANGVFHGWRRVDSLPELFCGDKQVYLEDPHVPNLLATPPGTEAYLTKSNAYRQGRVILQDKASCFPAYLLSSTAFQGDIIDACAAPGNKTTHLAALARSSVPTQSSPESPRSRITAVERDKVRARTLSQMVATAAADRNGLVTCLPGQDFARLDAKNARWKNVKSLLLDPSCSGSGIVGRDQGDEDEDAESSLVLPSLAKSLAKTRRPESNIVKSKVGQQKMVPLKEPEQSAVALEAEKSADQRSSEQDALRKRLHALQGFQLHLLLHAFQFPAAQTVVYSTCSVHAAENEHVVVLALSSRIGKQRGWRIMRREEQISGMRTWHVRGDVSAVSAKMAESGSAIVASEIADACIRCNKGTADGTMGFFAVGFVRDGIASGIAGNDEEGTHNLPGSITDRAGGISESINVGTNDDFEGFSD